MDRSRVLSRFFLSRFFLSRFFLPSCALSCGTSAASLLLPATSMKLLLVLMSSLALVDGPDESVSVKAAVGNDIILPCYLENKFDMVEWKLNGNTVHSYRSGADDLVDQHEQFKDRTSLFKKEMSRGNCSLKLTNVTEEDEGTYIYDVRLNRVYKEGIVKLTVESKNSNKNQPAKSGVGAGIGTGIGTGGITGIAIIVGAIIVDAGIVGAIIVDAGIVGAIIVDAGIVGAIVVGAIIVVGVIVFAPKRCGGRKKGKEQNNQNVNEEIPLNEIQVLHAPADGHE